MPPDSYWYCGYCSYGPHHISYHAFCVICNRRTDHTAELEGIRLTHVSGLTPTAISLASEQLSNIIQGTCAQEARSEKSSFWATESTKESNNYFSVAQVLPDTESERHVAVSTGAVRKLAEDSAAPFSRLPLPERLHIGDEDLRLVARASQKVNSSNLCALDYHNLLRGEFVSKAAQIEAFLSNPNSPWNSQLIAYSRVTLPGESSFSLETGEPATAPRRQPHSPRRRMEILQTRRFGACPACRRAKRAVSNVHIVFPLTKLTQ